MVFLRMWVHTRTIGTCLNRLTGAACCDDSMYLGHSNIVDDSISLLGGDGSDLAVETTGGGRGATTVVGTGTVIVVGGGIVIILLVGRVTVVGSDVVFTTVVEFIIGAFDTVSDVCGVFFRF